ncbi:MAG: cobyrinate a,c-diamide synthase [Desulfosarcinaceae bacterium]|nr:cobyrinate a,c-diamide synthase [Desulfosarcinaceae bacterium]
MLEKVPSNRRSRACPGFVVAALRGGSGKTIFSVGLIAALQRRGRVIAPFKKGPDYIDAGWLALAAGRSCYNLDTFLVADDLIRDSYHTHTQAIDLAVIEGNRGLYDCIDLEGRTSTAELAKLLDLPLLLCIDGTKTTRTMAAVVGGCIRFDPDLKLAGVLLNRVAGPRHEGILRTSIEHYCGVPVLGAVPKLRKQGFPERHMGLVPTPEHDWARPAIDQIADIAETYLDLDQIVRLAEALAPKQAPTDPDAGPDAGSVPTLSVKTPSTTVELQSEAPTVAVLRDSAFQFYYPENLEALRVAGARVHFCSPLERSEADQTPLSFAQAVYIGGGFPETHAKELAAADAFRHQLKRRADAGLPIYAECGGLMFLGEALELEGQRYEMCNILPAIFGFSRRPQGHGYTIVKVARENPYYAVGSQIKGHEFHYSSVISWKGRAESLAFEMIRGTGIHAGGDGLTYRNVLATYTHIHATGTPQWAPALVELARKTRTP